MELHVGQVGEGATGSRYCFMGIVFTGDDEDAEFVSSHSPYQPPGPGPSQASFLPPVVWHTLRSSCHRRR